MKILDLVVKHKWYDMEESGEKPEEYRVLSDHWVKRFLRLNSGRDGALKYLASLPIKCGKSTLMFAFTEATHQLRCSLKSRVCTSVSATLYGARPKKKYSSSN